MQLGGLVSSRGVGSTGGHGLGASGEWAGNVTTCNGTGDAKRATALDKGDLGSV